ncbi:MAG TPA: hypothetical protein VK590_12580, partial [Saprospiraceae bacterium]|nr:hypothetical protein [Saprospiraceae bacterium]
MSKNIRNSAWNLIDNFLYPFLFLITTPYFIDRLGEKEFGVWMLVNSVMITMQVFNLGLGTAVFKHVAAHLSVKAYDKIKLTFNTNFSLSCLIHIACILVSVSLAIGVKYFSFFKIEPAYINLVSGGIVLGGTIVGFKFYEQLVSYTFKAFERFDLAAWISSGTKLTILFLNILLVYFGYGLITLLISGIIISSLGILMGILFIKRLIPAFTLSFHYEKTSIRHELKFAVWPWFQSLAIIITFQCDRFFVVTYIGLATLTYYGLVATMFNHIHMGFNAIAPWLAPKITKLKTQGKEIKELYLTTRNFSLVISLTVLLVFSIVNAPILKLFLSIDKYQHAAGFIKLFTLFELFFVYAIVPNYFLNAAGHERLYFKIVIFYCTTIILGMLTGYYFNRTAEGILEGLTVGTAISMFTQNWVIDKKIFKADGLKDSLILFLPVVLIVLSILSSSL